MVKQKPNNKRVAKTEQGYNFKEAKEKYPFSSVSYSITLDNGLVATNPQDIERLQNYSLYST